MPVLDIIRQKLNGLSVYDVTEEDVKDYLNIYMQTIDIFKDFLQKNYLSVKSLERRNVIDFMFEYVEIINIKHIVLSLNVFFEVCRRAGIYDEIRCISMQETVALVCELLLIYLYEDETQDIKEVI